MPRRVQSCTTCKRQTNDAHICRRCANELHDLLVGSREPDGQPGIAWYVKRLRESAYGQTRMSKSVGAKSSNTGYALFGNQRAVELLARINTVLAVWEASTEALVSTHGHENGWLHTGSPTRDSERLEVKRARFIAAHTVLLRHHCPRVGELHADMLAFGREAWRIINRPNDTCCGPCPAVIVQRSICDMADPGIETPCATLLYAEEGAAGVECPTCHAKHDVDTLRHGLKAFVADMLFTRAELVNLMEHRLNDRIPPATFTKLLRDGRLRPRKIEQGQPDLYTYDDVVAARLKPVPHRRIRSAS